MRVDHIALTLRLTLADKDVWQGLPAAARQVGSELAGFVDRYCREHQLGYYPAIEYFRQVTEADQKLLDDAEQLAWDVSKKVREQLQSRLGPVFSTVKFRTVQTEAFALPPVRPGRSSAFEQLVSHYTPNRVRVELRVSLLRKDSDQRIDAMEGYARKMVFRWLGDIFDDVEVTVSARLDQTDKAG
jgi:hypothetical protein